MNGHFARGQIVVHFEQGVHFYEINQYLKDEVVVQQVFKDQDGNIERRGKARVFRPYYLQGYGR